MQNFQSHKRRSLAAALLFGASGMVLLSAEGAWAQTAAPGAPLPETAAAQPDANAVEAVVVTGSRLQTGFQAPTPVTVVGQAQMEQRAPADVYDIVRDLPSFRPSAGPSNSSYGIQGASQANLDLRGLGSARTLVLIDGKRHVPTDDSSNFDTNMIPSSMIDRTEVVTGGASAAYGSDAVAGVVNFIINTKLNGVKADLNYGESQHSDNQTTQISAAAGFAFMGGRGHFELGGDKTVDKGTDDFWKARDWGALEPGVVSMPTTRAAGLPANIVSNYAELDQFTAGGLIASGPLKGTAFGPNGQVYNFQYTSTVGTQSQIAGPGSPNFGNIYYQNTALVPAFDRAAAMANLDFDITPDVSFQSRLGYGSLHSHATTIDFPFPALFPVLQTNPFLPASVKAAMIANNLTSVTVARNGTDVGALTSGNRTETWQWDNTLKGKVFGDWKWDLDYSHGHTTYSAALFNTPRTADLYESAYVVTGPNGTPVCGDPNTNPYFNAQPAATKALLLANLSPGCVPYNIFGPGDPNAPAIKYFNGTSAKSDSIKQDELAANLAGNAFNLPAGPVSVAAGLEYRKLSIVQVGCPDCQRGALTNQNYGTYSPTVSVKEAYGELGVPLLKDQPFAKSLDLNGAMRRTDYSSSGVVTTWKVGFTYEPDDLFRFRGTQSHDIRAANPNELYYPGSAGGAGGANLTNKLTGVTAFTKTNTIGNSLLSPEIGDTTTAGVVFQPTWAWASGFRASVDYFHILIHNQIGTVAAQDVLDRLLIGKDQYYAQFVTLSSAALNGVLIVNATGLNINVQKEIGYDFEVDYRLPIEKVGLPGKFDIRSLATHVKTIRLIQGTTDTNNLGVTLPEWSANTNFTYTLDRFSANLGMRTQSNIKYSATLVGPDDPAYNPAASNSISQNWWHVPTYWNLYLGYDIIEGSGKRMQIYGNINNLMNTSPPPIAITLNTVGSGGNPYDLIGRSFKVGIRLQY